jgi:hypothetical protein
MLDNKVIEIFVGQILALITFFAFPALQYVLLKRFTAREGNPELWYLPQFGFRLVIRNLPRRHTLSAIKYRALLRQTVPAGSIIGAATYVDEILHQREDFYLFPGVDQVLVAFRIVGSSENTLEFVSTDVLGNERKRVPLGEFQRLICDYEATVKNLFNFDVKLGKRAEVTSDSLCEAWKLLRKDPGEREFPISKVLSVS